MHAKDLNTLDGGLNSRKLWFCVGVAIAITGVGVASIWAPGLVAIYATLIGGVLGACGLYVTGNVANTLVTSKAIVAASTTVSPAPDPSAPPVPPQQPPAPPAKKPQVVMEPQG